MTTLIFGGTGFIGSHVAEQCALAGLKTRVAVRSGSDRRFLQTLDVEIVEVGFRDDNALLALMADADQVINCIADTRIHVTPEMRAPTEIDLTCRLFRLAQQADVERFIQLSTVMVYGFDRPADPINETWPLRPKFSYNQSAADREEALLNCYESGKTHLVIVRPANTVGKRDTQFLPNFVNARKQGIFPLMGQQNHCFSCIDTRDIGRAMAHLCKIDVAETETFLVKGFDTDWLALKAALDDYFGKPTRLVKLPLKVMQWTARCMEALFPYGKEPPVASFSLAVITHDTLFDDAKIRATGFTPEYSLEACIKDTLSGSV